MAHLPHRRGVVDCPLGGMFASLCMAVVWWVIDVVDPDYED